MRFYIYSITALNIAHQSGAGRSQRSHLSFFFFICSAFLYKKKKTCIQKKSIFSAIISWVYMQGLWSNLNKTPPSLASSLKSSLRCIKHRPRRLSIHLAYGVYSIKRLIVCVCLRVLGISNVILHFVNHCSHSNRVKPPGATPLACQRATRLIRWGSACQSRRLIVGTARR